MTLVATPTWLACPPWLWSTSQVVLHEGSDGFFSASFEGSPISPLYPSPPANLKYYLLFSMVPSYRICSSYFETSSILFLPCPHFLIAYSSLFSDHICMNILQASQTYIICAEFIVFLTSAPPGISASQEVIGFLVLLYPHLLRWSPRWVLHCLLCPWTPPGARALPSPVHTSVQNLLGIPIPPREFLISTLMGRHPHCHQRAFWNTAQNCGSELSPGMRWPWHSCVTSASH